MQDHIPSSCIFEQCHRLPHFGHQQERYQERYQVLTSAYPKFRNVQDPHSLPRDLCIHWHFKLFSFP